MTPVTRASQSTFPDSTLDFIFTEILKFDATSPAYSCLRDNDIETLPDFLSIQNGDFDQLTYRVPSSQDSEKLVPKVLSLGIKQRMRLFIQYAKALINDPEEPIESDEGFLEISSTEFDTYRISSQLIIPGGNAQAQQPMTRNRNLTLNKPVTYPSVERFHRSKKDVARYPILKDDRSFGTFHSSTFAIARAQEVHQVFNPNYTPHSDEEIALFKVQQNWVYALLVTTLQTDQGRTFVREHAQDVNAQMVYTKLLKHHRDSPTSKLEVTSLQKSLITLTLDETSWKGTITGFILHWREQMRKLEELLPIRDHYSDGFRKNLLENAVSSISELRAVSSVETNGIAVGHAELTYSQYTALISAAATTLDHARLGKDRRPTPKRIVNYLDFHPEEHFTDQETDYSINYTKTAAPPGSTSDALNTNVDNEIWRQLSPWVQGLIRDEKRKLREARIASTPRRANIHDLAPSASDDDEPLAPDDAPNDAANSADDFPHADIATDMGLLAHLTQRAPMPQHDIRRVLGPKKPPATPPVTDTNRSVKKTMIVDGVHYIQKLHNTQYKFSQHQHQVKASLVDRGANGGLGGADVRVIEHTTRTADITGIDNHKIKDVPISTVAGLINSNKGPLIAIMHQYAYTGKGTSIHSSGQLEHHKSKVDDRSRTVGGKQMIVTIDNYAIPLNIRQGLPHMDMERPTEADMQKYPHVILTSDNDWDPTVLDNDITAEELANCNSDSDPYGPDNFSATGSYIGINQHIIDICDDDCPDLVERTEVFVNARQVQPNEPDYASMRSKFAWIPEEVIKKTFAVTTQFSRFLPRYPFRKHFKSRNPATNVHRRQEPVATDTVFADGPAICDGSTCAQIFVGRKSLVTDVYGMKTEKQFVSTLQDNIRKRGAMDKLISDRAQVEIGKKTLDILRAYAIDDWQSEPHHQHQNFAENRWETIKRYTNRTLNQTGAPASHWLLVLMWVCVIFNNISTPGLPDGRTPTGILTGSDPDISPLLCFTYHEPVYYSQSDAPFPSCSDERPGLWVGISESVGDQLTWKILTTDTDRPTIVHRSNVRTALNIEQKNRRLEELAGELTAPIQEIVKTRRPSPSENPTDASPPTRMSTIDPEELIGRTYLTDKEPDGTCQRAKIVRAIEQHSDELRSKPDVIKFLVSYDDEEKLDEIVAYNEIIDFVEREYTRDLDTSGDLTWNFKRISAHQGPLLPTDPTYKGCKYNVMIEWEDGSTTSEPLTVFAADDPVSCALYAKEKGLLDTPGWKRFKKIAKRDKKLVRMVRQARLKSIRRAPIYQFGFRVPRNIKEAWELDKENGTTRWKDAMTLELWQLAEYDTFRDTGKAYAPPAGYKRIRVHYVYAVKHDGRHKARLVADGHLTETPLESVYSGVVSLRSLRIAIFLAELNGQQIFAADVGSAYLEAETKELVFIIADESFGELCGHLLIVRKALYGLKSSGKRYWEKFAETMVDMGFTQSEADSEVWMRRAKDLWEYVCVYVDDLAIISMDPQGICDAIVDKYKYKLKGVGPITYHLGCDFGRDEDGTLYFGPRKYVNKMMEAYKLMFGEEPSKKYHSPLEKGDHPELDDSPELNDDLRTKYLRLIGQCQWLISLGRFDTATAVMTMSRFRAAPREGHLTRVKRIYGYVRNMPNGAIRVRTEMPDYSELDADYKIYDWANTVYGNVKEAVPHNLPTPLGKPVLTTTYKDANLYHDYITGRSAMGIIHLLNGTPIDWYTKRQDTVETATYGSEFVAARVATDQIIDLRITLRQLGVPVEERSYLFGDNKSVVTSSTIPHSGLNKRHTALCYHRVREAVSSFLRFIHVPTGLNIADVLSKHCGHQDSWHLIKPLLFWPGNTLECITPPKTPKGTKPSS